MYSYGFNTPGYLPESEPNMAEDSDSAKRALIDEILRHADHADDSEAHALASALSHAAEDLNLSDVSAGWGLTVCDPDREHDLGTHYWIEPCDTAEIDVTSDGWMARADDARDCGVILTFTDGETTWSDPLRCPDCFGTHISPAHGSKLAQCLSCGIAYDTMD